MNVFAHPTKFERNKLQKELNKLDAALRALSANTPQATVRSCKRPAFGAAARVCTRLEDGYLLETDSLGGNRFSVA